MNKLISSTLTTTAVVGLLFAAASCSSDKDSSSTTAADTAVSTVATTGDTTAGSTVAPTGSLDEQALAITLAGVAAAGATADEACLAGVISQLSDADKQIIVDGGVGGTVTLSTEGEKLGADAQACVTAPTTATT